MISFIQPITPYDEIDIRTFSVVISGGQVCNIPSLTEHTYHSITGLALRRLSARNCNCSQISTEFLTSFQSTLQKLDLSCNPLRNSFGNIITGLSTSNLSVLLLDNINRIPNPGDVYCPWNLTGAILKPLKKIPLKIFSFHSNQLRDYGDLKLQRYSPGLMYLDVSYNYLNGHTNLLSVQSNNGSTFHNLTLGHRVTYQPLGLRYIGLRGLTTNKPCGQPPVHRLNCNQDSYLFLEDKFYWDNNHDPDIVDLRFLSHIRKIYLRSGNHLATIFTCTKNGNSLPQCFQKYRYPALRLLPCLSGLEECFAYEDILQLSICTHGQDYQSCLASFIFRKQSVIQCSKRNLHLPGISFLELLQFYFTCLNGNDSCSSVASSIMPKLHFKRCLIQELSELSEERQNKGLVTFRDSLLLNKTVNELFKIDPQTYQISYNLPKNTGHLPPNITTFSFGENQIWKNGGAVKDHLSHYCVNRTLYHNNLETVDLSDSSLDFLPCRNLRGFQYLSNLTLNNAKISGWHKNLFIGSPIKYIHMRGVRGFAQSLQNDHRGKVFSFAPGLEILDITDIRIRYFCNIQMFANYRNLTHLHVCNNDLHDWNVSISRNTGLKTLDLRNNRIENIEKKFRTEIEQLVSSNQLKVYLEGNDVDCSNCESEYITWLLQSGAVSDHRKIRCKSDYYSSKRCLVAPYCANKDSAGQTQTDSNPIADGDIAAIVVGLTVILALIALIIIIYNNRYVLIFKLLSHNQSGLSGASGKEDTLVTPVCCCHSNEFTENIIGMYYNNYNSF